jgi:signal transduction histidine kinase
VAAARSSVLARPVLSAVTLGLFVVLYTACGAYLLRRRHAERLGLLVGAAGLVAAAGVLAASADEGIHTAGRVAVAALVVYLAYLFLSYPEGRLRLRLERATVAAFAAGSVVVWALALLTLERLPPTGPIYDCARCPVNAAQVTSLSPTAARTVAYVVAGFTAAGLGAVSALLLRRAWSPALVQRRALAPLVACVVVWSAAHVVYTLIRTGGSDAGAGILRPAVAAAALAIPVAILLGQWHGHLFASHNLVEFASELGSVPLSAARIEAMMRKAVGDPGLRLLRWRPEQGRYVDVWGEPSSLPDGGARVVGVQAADGRPAAAVVFDSVLIDAEKLVEALTRTSLLVLENDRLIRELGASRARIALEAANERLRLERDLHDGAQRRLLVLKLALAELRTGADGELAAGLEGAIDETDAAIDEIRSLGAGIFPGVLLELGLGKALESVAVRSPIPVHVADGQLLRSTPAVEYAIYLCACEALQNAIKHGGPGTRVRIALAADGDDFRFSVVDDGAGFDLRSLPSRRGILNMQDRIGSVGGELMISSSVGAGTTVSGVVPGALAGGA